ncbi:TetR/AcrR family transcriptional regulator [Paenibacillus sp. 19GGS1-52]|uniref:TetR/AcrR family transcriptional regulator n=1 Tax=Paenibacillus sp. 19GGS1-52 TaxID=2758563 RepID=UPI001EFB5C7A|nr:TetR/AcrR family transcriptional regulator [Paenibacillus sp. 19GGS1-52]ULO08163.1 TetR/AcrR family transcriptional regulator [Paenibacillus sp. 19GGS1-52]
MNRPSNVDKYFNLILPHIRKHGFSHLKIEEILKYMNISKATFYKHFTSKDDLIKQLVSNYTAYVINIDPLVLDETLTFEYRFGKIFLKSVLSIMIMTDEFYEDIKQFQPSLISLITAAHQNRCELLQRFYFAGFEKGSFNPINPIIYFYQDDAVIRSLMNPMLINHYNTSQKQQLIDFYILKKYTLFKADRIGTMDDSAMELEISQILQTISFELQPLT